MSHILSPVEQADLVEILREERMARDLYRAFYRQHRLPVFKRIAESESRHADTVARMLVRFRLGVGSGYGGHQASFRRALAMGSRSVGEALEAAMSLEMADIDEIAEAAARSGNVHVRCVLAQLGGGSFNHLRAFARQLVRRGISTELRWQDFVSREELESPCNLAHKILPLFQARGVPAAGPFGLAADES